MSWGRYDWAPYVSVSQKLGMATRLAAQQAKKEKREVSPIKVQGSTIAKTFWGKAWCDNLTAYQDFSNRLPRGATYVRNGSVVDLVISPKKIAAIAAGSEPYTVKIEITEIDSKRWRSIRSECSASIDSLLDLLSGKLSDGVMKRLTDQKAGLFPSPREIRMSCSCPDYSSCCKHLAAVMYGVGARLDNMPELLFVLRGVDHQELVSQAIAEGNLDRELSVVDNSGLGTQDLSELFGIELNSSTPTIRESGKKGSSAKTPGSAKPSSQTIGEPTANKKNSSKQRKSTKNVVPEVGSVKPATSSKGRKSGSKTLASTKADTKKSTARKTSVAEAMSAIALK